MPAHEGRSRLHRNRLSRLVRHNPRCIRIANLPGPKRRYLCIALGIHPITKDGPLYLLVELGPLFVFGVVGLYLALRRGDLDVFHSMLLLLVLALFVGFTLIVPYEPNVVIRKAIKVVQVPLVVFASVAFSGYLDLPPRHWLRIAGVSVILAGSLTLLSDILQYVDPEPNKTTFVSAGKMQTLDWIRKRTAPDAIVQLLDQVRPGRGLELGSFEFDITINALGERRTLFGNYKKPYENHVANAVIENRRAILEQVYLGKSPESLKQNLDRLPPHYILVDSKSPGPLDAVRRLKDSGYLKEVFRSGEIMLLLKRSPKTGDL